MITTISQLIAQVETGDNPAALRFEPEHVARAEFIALAQDRQGAYCSYSTAKALCAFSVGKYQIMVDSLYWLGYKGSVLDFIAHTEDQDAMFSMFIKARGIDYSLSQVIEDSMLRYKFAALYNGDGKVYGDRMLAVYNASKGK